MAHARPLLHVLRRPSRPTSDACVHTRARLDAARTRHMRGNETMIAQTKREGPRLQQGRVDREDVHGYTKPICSTPSLSITPTRRPRRRRDLRLPTRVVGRLGARTACARSEAVGDRPTEFRAKEWRAEEGGRARAHRAGRTLAARVIAAWLADRQ